MNVETLVRGTFTDKFYLTSNGQRSPCDRPLARLRLTNGQIVENSVVVVDSNGDTVSTDAIEDIDYKYGIVVLNTFSRGAYRVNYDSGFEPEPIPDDPPENYNPEYRVLQNVPDWIKGIAVDLFIQWTRSQRLALNLPKNVSYRPLVEVLSKDLYTRIYSRYMRPRVGVFWTEEYRHG